MMKQDQVNHIFTLDIDFKNPIKNTLFSLLKAPVEHFLAFPRLNKVYADIAAMEDGLTFPEKALKKLNVSYNITDEDRARIKSEGPVIVVANHPFGGIEGIILASILRSIRDDVKFMANFLLNYIPEMQDMLISVNPFKSATSAKNNVKPIRECIRWVSDGGMLVVFPAGVVSHFDVQKGIITDPAWSTSIARIIRKTKSPVHPVFFRGTNSATFHMAGVVHPLLRTAMLPNELFNKNNENIQVRIGELLPFEKINLFDNDDAMIKYLRFCTYLLDLQSSRKRGRSLKPVIRPVRPDLKKRIISSRNPDRMSQEVYQLLPSQILMESGDYLVIQAEADQIPEIIYEIGRLREVTFRAICEGTGKSLDLDQYDASYLHLFLWNKARQEVVGAYRLGKADEIVRKHGLRGLYTSTLFRYKPGFIACLGPALELGRSFVRVEYQKSYNPLLLLWKGIARFIVDNPHYKILFGPVSISCEYEALSKELIVDYLKANRYRSDLAKFVQPRRPLRSTLIRKWDIDGMARMMKDDGENISDLISNIEEDGKGIPVLLKQYLKLGGQILGFNVDPAFGHVLDGLIMVDLLQTDSRMLDRYLTKDGAQRFLGYHETLNQERLETCA